MVRRQLADAEKVNAGRFVLWPRWNVMYDRKVKGYGTVTFANQVIRRRARNKVARKSRKVNRTRSGGRGS